MSVLTHLSIMKFPIAEEFMALPIFDDSGVDVKIYERFIAYSRSLDCPISKAVSRAVPVLFCFGDHHYTMVPRVASHRSDPAFDELDVITYSVLSKLAQIYASNEKLSSDYVVDLSSEDRVLRVLRIHKYVVLLAEYDQNQVFSVSDIDGNNVFFSMCDSGEHRLAVVRNQFKLAQYCGKPVKFDIMNTATALTIGVANFFACYACPPSMPVPPPPAYIDAMKSQKSLYVATGNFKFLIVHGDESSLKFIKEFISHEVDGKVTIEDCKSRDYASCGVRCIALSKSLREALFVNGVYSSREEFEPSDGANDSYPLF